MPTNEVCGQHRVNTFTPPSKTTSSHPQFLFESSPFVRIFDMTLRKRLLIYTIILLVVFITTATGIYYVISTNSLKKELFSQGELMVQQNILLLDDFFSNARNITEAIASSEKLKNYLLSPSKSQQLSLEQEFLQIYKKIDIIQAIRLVDNTGHIRVFIKEDEILSENPRYTKISLSHKKFFIKARNYKGNGVIFSNMERGKLPNEETFCPSMVRSIKPLTRNNQRIGYLVINFWGDKIGSTLNLNKDPERKHSFLVEVNLRDSTRNGIFLYHWNKKYEFANQFRTGYTFQGMYGLDLWQKLTSHKCGVLRLKSGDFMFFDTFYPYKDSLQAWKVCSILNHDQFFKSVVYIKRFYFLIVLVSIVFVIIFSHSFSRKFTNPIWQILGQLERIGRGDLSGIDPIKGDYEIEIISKSISTMVESLRKYIEELHDTRKKLEMLDRLSSLATLSAGLAHELSTPLNSIILISEMLADELEGEKKDDVLTIKNQAERCMKIIHSLREFSARKLEDEHIELIRLGEVIKELKPLLEFYASKFNFEVKLQDTGYIKGNRIQIEQLVINLVINAVDALKSTKNGVIRLETFNENGHVVLKIEDNGEGISNEHINRIFDPFFTTKDVGKGTGLGLSIVHGIIKSHGGHIDVKSEKGRGTIFIIRFPEAKNENSIN